MQSHYEEVKKWNEWKSKLPVREGLPISRYMKKAGFGEIIEFSSLIF